MGNRHPQPINTSKLTQEEDNFLRLVKLVSGVAPKAVRETFDQFFSPTRLNTTLKQEEPKLRQLNRQKRITTTQLNLLLPTSSK
jgi:hypothetical protein